MHENGRLYFEGNAGENAPANMKNAPAAIKTGVPAAAGLPGPQERKHSLGRWTSGRNAQIGRCLISCIYHQCFRRYRCARPKRIKRPKPPRQPRPRRRKKHWLRSHCTTVFGHCQSNPERNQRSSPCRAAALMLTDFPDGAGCMCRWGRSSFRRGRRRACRADRPVRWNPWS